MATRLLVHRFPARLALVVLAALALVSTAGLARRTASQARVDVTIHARRYAYDPPRIEVGTGDIVRVTLVADDTPHSFTIDAYRISKRAVPGHPVTFEFRAELAGTFAFYCELKRDDGCRRMRGELVVTDR